MKNYLWERNIGTLISAIWMYTLAGIIGTITETINDILNWDEMLYAITSMLEGGEYEVAPNFADLVEFLCSFLVILGYYLFFRSICRFVKFQKNDIDSENANKIKTSYILLIVALFTNYIPFIGGLISFVLLIIAYIKQLSGYKGLSNSDILPDIAKKGLKTLYTCTILTLIFSIIGCIPLIGSALESIASIIIFFNILSAWKKVKAGAPELSEEEAIAIQSKEPNKHVAQLSDYLVSIFSINFIFNILIIATWVNIIPNITLVNDTFNGYKTFYITPIALYFIQTLFFIFIYFKLYSSKNHLISDLGKIGIIILIILNTIILINTINNYIGFYNSYHWFSYIFLSIETIGLTLFAIGSNMPKAIKIAIISYIPIVFIIECVLSYFIMYIQFEDPQNGRIYYNSVLLIASTIYFIFIYTQTQKWKTNSIGH